MSVSVKVPVEVKSEIQTVDKDRINTDENER